MSYKWWIIVAICLFGAGLGIGLVSSLAMPDVATDLLDEDLAALAEFAAMLVPFKVSTAVFIFLKNISVLLLSFIFSPVLCLFPFAVLTFNGLLLSFVATIAAQEESIGFVLAALLPHGIFELPAIIIGEAAALSFGIAAIAALFSEDRRKVLLPNLKQNLRYLAIACVLLIPAAIIETFVTPLFIM